MQLERLDRHVVHHVAEDVDRAAVYRLHRDALEDVRHPVEEAARVPFGVIHLDAVVGQLAQVVVVDVDRGATGRAEGVDGIGEAPDAVVADDVSLAGDLDAASILDALGSRPGRGALDHVVGDEVILGRRLAYCESALRP